MKINKQKFMHYAFNIVLSAFGLGTASLIVFSLVTAFQEIIAR